MNLKKILWLMPFASFFIGYQIINIAQNQNEIAVPNLIGKTLNQAVKIASDKNLNLRISAEKEDSQLPEGTIINQIPNKQKIKPNQSIYLTISKKAQSLHLPELKEKKLNEIQNIIKQNNLKNKVYYQQSEQLADTCISYTPNKNQLIKNKKIILYISSENKKPFIFPDVKNHFLKDVIYALNLNNLKANIITKDGSTYDENKNYIVIEQKPIAGSIVFLDKINIQLLVSKISGI